MKTNDLGLCGIMSALVFYLVNRFVGIVLLQPGTYLNRVSTGFDKVLPEIISTPVYVNLSKGALISGLIGAAITWLIYIYNSFQPKNYMPGKEHGSAEWGKASDIAPFRDKNPENNIILTATEELSMSDRMKRTRDDDYNRNKNVLVIGGSGSGKTRFFVKPNLMQLHSSYIITDPKGSLIQETGRMFLEAGYRIKVFDLINREKSDLYNPFDYLKSEDDILKLINNLIANTTPPQSKNAGDFWEKAETALLEAIFGYILFELVPEDRTMGTVMDMLRLAEVREDDENFKSLLDFVFEELKETNADAFSVKQYEIFKLAAGKTAKSILVSVGTRLAPFNINSIRRMVSADTLELDMIGSEKTALYIILPDTDRSFNFLAAMMLQQMFDILIYRADNDYQGKLPFHVRCMLDEFANIGQIPQLEILISTIRSRGISMDIIVQNLAQIKNLYKDTWEVITGNCDSLLFLGGLEQSTLEYISKLCGKATIDNRNSSETKGQNPSYSLQYQNLGRDLITPDEAGALKGRTCILKIRGCKPFKSQKYDIERHRNYNALSDGNSKNRFTLDQRKEWDTKSFFENVETVQAIETLE